jgi:hypothetical protein
MIEEARGNIDYDESGAGPTMVLVPGVMQHRSRLATRYRRLEGPVSLCHHQSARLRWNRGAADTAGCIDIA